MLLVVLASRIYNKENVDPFLGPSRRLEHVLAHETSDDAHVALCVPAASHPAHLPVPPEDVDAGAREAHAAAQAEDVRPEVGRGDHVRGHGPGRVEEEVRLGEVWVED